MKSVRQLAGALFLAAFAVGCQDQTDVTSPEELGNQSGTIPTGMSPDRASLDLGGPMLSVASGASAMALVAISQPDAAYVAATALIDISGIPNNTNVNSITDGVQTVSFSSTMNKVHAEVSGWATWGDPPDTEVNAPHVLHSLSASSVTLTLSLPTPTFGFEIEPNPFTLQTYRVDFYSNGGTVLEGTVTRAVHGSHGARLMAATTTGAAIDAVIITGAVDFAIGRVRYVPGPTTKAQCKNGGWQSFGFRNQGLCIQFVNTGKDSR